MLISDHNEAQDLHPRVAYLLDIGGWAYIHEYDYPGGQIDFVAISRFTGEVAIIECKVGISSTWYLIQQVNRYHRDFGLPQATKQIYTLILPTEKQVRRLRGLGIKVAWADIHTLSVGIRSRKRAIAEFMPLFQHFYGHDPRPFRYEAIELGQHFHHFWNDEDMTVGADSKRWPDFLDSILDEGMED